MSQCDDMGPYLKQLLSRLEELNQKVQEKEAYCRNLLESKQQTIRKLN